MVERSATLTTETPDTFFSIPASVNAGGKRVSGFVTSGNICKRCGEPTHSHDHKRLDGTYSFAGTGLCIDRMECEPTGEVLTFKANKSGANASAITPIRLAGLRAVELLGESAYENGKPIDWTRSCQVIDGLSVIVDVRIGTQIIGVWQNKPYSTRTIELTSNPLEATVRHFLEGDISHYRCGIGDIHLPVRELLKHRVTVHLDTSSSSVWFDETVANYVIGALRMHASGIPA
jgi:hypothetical protein